MRLLHQWALSFGTHFPRRTRGPTYRRMLRWEIHLPSLPTGLAGQGRDLRSIGDEPANAGVMRSTVASARLRQCSVRGNFADGAFVWFESLGGGSGSSRQQACKQASLEASKSLLPQDVNCSWSADSQGLGPGTCTRRAFLSHHCGKWVLFGGTPVFVISIDDPVHRTRRPTLLAPCLPGGGASHTRPLLFHCSFPAALEPRQSEWQGIAFEPCKHPFLSSRSPLHDDGNASFSLPRRPPRGSRPRRRRVQSRALGGLRRADSLDYEHPLSPDLPPLVPRIPDSSPPREAKFGFTPAVPGQACLGVDRFECSFRGDLYCETTTKACQQSLPVGAACDPTLFIQPCFAPVPDGASGFDVPPLPGAVCVAQADGRGMCVPTAAAGESCADPAVSGCVPADSCDAGICIEAPFVNPGADEVGRLMTCASDADCGARSVCRPAMDGRKRCLAEQEGNQCFGVRGRVPSVTCSPGTFCDARTNKCLREGATLAIGERCSRAGSHDQLVVCDSGDSNTQAFCPFVEGEDFNTLRSSCELDIVGRPCGGDGDCDNGGTKQYECDSGICAKIDLGGSDSGQLGSCDNNEDCFINIGNSLLQSRCALAADGVKRCLQERNIGVSCAPVGSLIPDFLCAKNTRCHAPSQTCVRDVPAVGAGENCGTTPGVQFVACVEGTSCGAKVNSDGFRQCE